MKRIEQNELLPMINDILVAFKKYCDKNDLKFYLGYGTLLGAVRHKGFIPWDDDIDVQMKTDQINKLVKCLEKTNCYIDDENRYLVLLPFDKRNVYPIIKVVDTKTVVYEKNLDKKFATGLWIDVFELENVPADINVCRKISKKQRLYTNLNKIVIAGNLKDTKYKVLNIFAYPVRLLFNLLGFDTNYWTKKFMSLQIQQETGYKGGLIWTNCMKDRIESKVFDEESIVIFENNEYLSPKNYDKYLTTLYGDYMKIPPESERIRHDFEAYHI